MGRRRRRRPLPSRIRGAIRAFLAFLFSNVGTVVLVIGYTIAGAFMFQAIEGAGETERVTMMSHARERTTRYLWSNVTMVLNPLDEREIKHRVSSVLLRYQRLIVQSVRRGWDIGRPGRQWSFSNAFLYSMTVITTIGYGHLSPRTNWGKVATMFYALLGMPLFLLYLSNVGSLFARWFKCVYALLCLCRGCPGFRKQRVRELTDPNLEISDAESIEKPLDWRRHYADSDLSVYSFNEYERSHRPQRSVYDPDGDIPYRIQDIEIHQRIRNHRNVRSNTKVSPHNSNVYNRSDYIAHRHTLPKNLHYFPPDFREQGYRKACKDRSNIKDFKDIKKSKRHDNVMTESNENKMDEKSRSDNEKDCGYEMENRFTIGNEEEEYKTPPWKHNQRTPKRSVSFPHPGNSRIPGRRFTDYPEKNPREDFREPHSDYRRHIEPGVMFSSTTDPSSRLDQAYKIYKISTDPINLDLFGKITSESGNLKLPKIRSWSGPETGQFLRSKSTTPQIQQATPLNFEEDLLTYQKHDQCPPVRRFLRSQSAGPHNGQYKSTHYDECALNRNKRKQLPAKNQGQTTDHRSRPYQEIDIREESDFISNKNRHSDPCRHCRSFPKDSIHRSYSTYPASHQHTSHPRELGYSDYSSRVPVHGYNYSTYPASRQHKTFSSNSAYSDYPPRVPVHGYRSPRVVQGVWRPDPRRGWSEPVHPSRVSTVSSDFSYISFDPQSITVPISVCVGIMVGYLIFGSMIFGLWEQWDLLDGAYFCFISLTSIGFGDFVPGERIYTPRVETSFIVCSLYLMLGMALVAMCFNLMQEQVIHYFAGVRRAVRRICQCVRCKR